MRLFITRHAEDIGHKIEDRYRNLTEIGKKQAQNLGLIVKEFKPSYIFCSSLTRSKKTAAIVADICGLAPIENKLLDEQYSGPNSDDLAFKQSKGFISLDDSYDGGESYQELVNRVKQIIFWMKNKIDPIKEQKNLVLITHGRLMTFLVAKLLNFPQNGFFLAINNTAYVIIKISDRWRPMLVLPVPGEQYI